MRPPVWKRHSALPARASSAKASLNTNPPPVDIRLDDGIECMRNSHFKSPVAASRARNAP